MKTCVLTASLGLVDQDGAPPVATLITPEQESEVAPDSPVVLRFSELINASRFSGGNSTTTVPAPSQGVW